MSVRAECLSRVFVYMASRHITIKKKTLLNPFCLWRIGAIGLGLAYGEA